MRTVTRDGLVFDLTTAGPPDGEPVVLLHGFPQSARCWDAVTPALAAAGLRTFAPDQRGYSPGAPAPPGGPRTGCPRWSRTPPRSSRRRWRRPGRPRAHVVGHDWGAAVAWTLAGNRPELVARSPGSPCRPRARWPTALRRPRQLLASWYMAVFAVPGLAERVFAVPAATAWSPALVRLLVRSGQSRERAERDAAGLADPAALTAALNWYRAIPLSRATRSRPRPHPRCSSGATATPP